MNEIALVPDVVPDAVPDAFLDVAPSNPKDLAGQNEARSGLKSPARRKPYTPPLVEDLGSIESITFNTSFILR